MRSREFIKRNWLGILGLAVGILGVVSSYYFYSMSQQTRDPSILELTNSPIFSSPDGLKSDKFALVTKPELKEVNENVYVHELAFWNKGSLAIKKKDILKEIYLEYPAEVEVIDSFISSATRPDIINAQQHRNASKNRLYLSFDILEKNDGFKVQIIYVSNEPRIASLKGSIEGVTAFSTEDELVADNIHIAVGKFFIAAFILLIVVLVFGGIVYAYDKFLEAIFSRAPKAVRVVLFYFLLAFLLLVVGSGIWSGIQKIAQNEGKRSVPGMESTLNNKD